MVLISKSYISSLCTFLYVWAYAGDFCFSAIDALPHAHPQLHNWYSMFIAVSRAFDIHFLWMCFTSLFSRSPSSSVTRYKKKHSLASFGCCCFSSSFVQHVIFLSSFFLRVKDKCVRYLNGLFFRDRNKRLINRFRQNAIWMDAFLCVFLISFHFSLLIFAVFAF